MQEKVSYMGFSLRMEISVPRDNCFVGNSTEPRYPPNTVIPREGNFDSHLKHMKDIYSPSESKIKCHLFCILTYSLVHKLRPIFELYKDNHFIKHKFR